jgi:hypothetical protein
LWVLQLSLLRLLLLGQMQSLSWDLLPSCLCCRWPCQLLPSPPRCRCQPPQPLLPLLQASSEWCAWACLLQGSLGAPNLNLLLLLLRLSAAAAAACCQRPRQHPVSFLQEVWTSGPQGCPVLAMDLQAPAAAAAAAAGVGLPAQ